MRKPKRMTYDFASSDGQYQIHLSLEKYTLKLTAEILVDQQSVCFEEMILDASYWLKFFDFDGHRFLICIKEVDYGTSYDVMCYQNGRSLTSNDTVEELKRRIEDPFYGETEYSQKDRKKDLLWSVFGSVLAAAVVVLIWGRNARWWERLLQFFGTLILYWGNKWLNRRADRKARNRLLKQISENDKNN